MVAKRKEKAQTNSLVKEISDMSKKKSIGSTVDIDHGDFRDSVKKIDRKLFKLMTFTKKTNLIFGLLLKGNFKKIKYLMF